MVREQVIAAILDEAALVLLVIALAVLLIAIGAPLHILLPAIAVAGFIVLALIKGVKAQLRKPLAGAEVLIGKKGFVKEYLGHGVYLVVVEGELWRAVCAKKDCGLGVGSRVCIVEVEGLLLKVLPC